MQQQQQHELTEEKKESDLCVVTVEYDGHHRQQRARQMKADKTPQPRLMPINLQHSRSSPHTH